MPAFRNTDGPGTEILLKDFHENSKNSPAKLIELSDIEREMSSAGCGATTAQSTAARPSPNDRPLFSACGLAFAAHDASAKPQAETPEEKSMTGNLRFWIAGITLLSVGSLIYLSSPRRRPRTRI